MKKTIFYLAISVLFLFNNVSAQNSSSDSNVVLKKLDNMKKELNLNETQVNSIKPLLLDNYERNKMFKKNIEMINGVKEQNNQTTDQEISKILTPEQYKLYVEKKELQKEKKMDRRISEKMAYYRQELKLNDQQYKDLKVLIEQNTIQKKAFKDGFKNDEVMLNTEMKNLKNRFNEQIKKILNPEQLKKYNEINGIAKP